MIRPFLEHHIRRARRGEIKNAVNNCHCVGLSSIVFHDAPENRIRMFYAHPTHQLFKNRLPFSEDMTVAVHTHHCHVTLHRLFGDVTNVRVTLEADERGPLQECLYSSKLNGGSGGLAPTGQRFSSRANYGALPVSLEASDLHTVLVRQGTPAAWLVIEGQEWRDYKPLCYTRNPTFNPEGMYVPMTPSEITDVIAFTLENL